MSVSPEIPSTAKAEVPAVLLPYQRAWIDDPAKLKVSEKSRRTGLTWAEAADDVLIAAAAKGAGGQNVYYIGYNQDMAIEYIEACAMWAKAFSRAASAIEEGIWEEDSEDKHIKTFTIKFPDSGHRIVALSSRPANLRGKQGVVVIDEAAFHEKLDQLLKAALALLIWGGKVRVISTHNGDTNPFNELIHEVRAGKRRGSVQRIEFQEAVSQGLFQRVCLRLGEEWTEEAERQWVREVYDFYGDDAAEELDVVPSHSAGSYLSRVLIESRMAEAPVLRLSRGDDFGKWPLHLRQAEIRDWCERELLPRLEALNPDREHCLGEDFARSGDLTVIAPQEIGQDLVRRTKLLVELRNIPFKQQEQILFYIMDRLPGLRSAALDARGNGQQLAEAAADRYGSALVHQVMLSDKWYAEALPGFKAAFEDGDIEVPKDGDVLDDLRMLQVINGVPKLPKASSGRGEEKRHGDAAIALALAWYASKQEGAPIEFMSTGRARAGAEGLAAMDRVGFGAVAGNVDTGGF